MFGYAISFELDSADSYRIGAKFCQQTSVLDDILEMYLNGELTDFYFVLVFSLLKPFTNNPKILFGTFGLVMDFGAYLCMSKLYGMWSGKRNKSFSDTISLFPEYLLCSHLNSKILYSDLYIYVLYY